MDISLSSIAVSLYWAENWKLSPVQLFFSVFPPCVQANFDKKVVKLGRRYAFNFPIFHTISFNVADKSVHISSRLLVCVCTFLLVDKIVFGLLAFGDNCFSFCIELNLAQRMFVFFIHL